MSTLVPLAAVPGHAAPATREADRAQLAGAAKQFEAMLLRQMLAAARKTSFDDGLFSSEAMGTFREMQDDRVADIVAGTGSLGLAKLIEAQLARLTGGGG